MKHSVYILILPLVCSCQQPAKIQVLAAYKTLPSEIYHKACYSCGEPFVPNPAPYFGWTGYLDYAAWLPGDFDFDGDVDQDDLEIFEWCASGPNIPRDVITDNHYVACWLMDFDRDCDVDQEDFGVFQKQLGKGVTNN